MNSPIVRRMLMFALALLAATLWVSNAVLAPYTTLDVRLRALMVALVAAVIGIAVAWFVSSSLARRVSRLKEFAESLLQPGAPQRPVTLSDDELGHLEQSLTDVAARLRESVERWKLESARREAILAGMAEGVLAVDRDLRVIFCNNAFARAVGARRPISERMPVMELVRDSEVSALFGTVLATGENIKRTLKIAVAGGRAFEVQAGPVATPAGGGVLAIFYDMTDLERLDQVRKDFVANVSHEMRTPLAAIVGYSDTLLDGGLEDPENNHKFVEIIRSNAIRLNSIASDLLVLSELESGNIPGEPERIAVREVLEGAIVAVAAEAQARNVRLVFGDVQDVHVRGNRFRLEQAVLNLLVNAVKFNRTGGFVRVDALANGDGNVHIAVADGGVGIPSQDLPRIFERFYRVDKARSRQVGGTGLGLSIVKHVVERMEGTIQVESQLGKGSTFTVVLPSC
jgi:two-component system, OmpR family, phosphate regulon sensor histidine kinase PhoR